MVEASVVAIDLEATVESVADTIAPHPTPWRSQKAGLVALGRAIDVLSRRPTPRPAASNR
jgi:hypothetical protein